VSNTITGLVPTLYEALDIVARELTGFVAAVTRNSSAERAALNQTITYPIVPAATTADITPGTTAPDDGDQTIGTDSLTISRSKYSPVRWSGEEQLALGSNGVYNVVLRDQFAQSMRALVNLVEADLAGLFTAASRAVGTAGTTPFGTAADFSDFAAVQQVLDDNGAPVADRHLVLGSAAISNIRGKQSVLFKANEAGTEDLLRLGIIGMVEGLAIHNSAQVVSHTAGTGASHLVNNASNYAAGSTTIALDTGTGTILAGDVISDAVTDASHKYVVKTALTAGSLVLNNPGLMAQWSDNNAITYAGNYKANMAFHRAAIHLVTRAPAMPAGGDSASDVMEITDPVTGLAFQIAMYKQYRRVKFEVGLAWGFKASKSEFIVNLMG
jgi:hypothetical protein